MKKIFFFIKKFFYLIKNDNFFSENSPKSNALIKLRNGLTFQVFSKFDLISNALREQGEFDPWTSRIASIILPENKKGNVIDIGANLGTFCIPLAKNFPKINFIAFEAQKKVFDVLNNNINLNNIKKLNASLDVGIHTNGSPIVFLISKYGPAIKFTKDDKDAFISVTDKPTLIEAIKLIDNFQTNVIKKIDKYEIRTGKYGPYILYNKNFYSIKDKDPNNITKEECDKIVKIKK